MTDPIGYCYGEDQTGEWSDWFTSAVYAEIGTELSWLIRKDVANHENQTG